MGSYFQYGLAAGSSTSRFCESADPVDLMNRCNAIIQEQAATEETKMASCQLSGAGDGHTFVVHMVFVKDEGGGGITDAVVGAYMAADDLHLALQRAARFAAMYADDAGGTVVDELVAGASKGTRHMGLIITGAESGGD